MIVGAAREQRVVARASLRWRGRASLALGRIDAALVVLGDRLVAAALDRRERRNWTATGFIYAAAAEMASVLLRLDPSRDSPR